MTGKEHVQNIIAQTKNFSLVNSASNNEVISYLYALRDFLLSQENSFYSKIGVQDIKGLNFLLDSISLTYNLAALNAGGPIYRILNGKYIFSDKQKTGNYDDYIETNIFNLFTQLLSGTSASQIISNSNIESSNVMDICMNALSNVFNKTFGNSMMTVIFSAEEGGRSRTGYYAKDKTTIGNAQVTLNLSKGLRNGKIEIINDRFVITGNPAVFSEAVDREIRERIRPALMKELKIELTDKTPFSEMSESQLREVVNRTIMDYGVMLDADDLAAANSIAINGSGGGISGYLGELQSRLYFKQLFKGVKDTKIIDAGANYIKSLGGASQMDPADTIVQVANEVFNIQVKNYAKGGAEWSGSTKKLFGEQEVRDISSAESFVKDRLQINNSSLLEYFGAVTWHNLNPEYDDNPLYWEYSQTYSELVSIFESLKASFDTFLPNIIRLVAIIDGAEDLQYENFYFQKGHMIPASAIIDGIIDALQNTPLKKIYTSSYSMYPGPSHYTSKIPYLDNYTNFAKETSIAWRVTINFGKVLASVGL